MSNVGLSLDEIIAKTKGARKGRGNDSSFKSDTVRRSAGGAARNGGGRRSGGGGFGAGRQGAFSKNTPSGKWRHDRFADNDAEDIGFVGGPSPAAGGNPNRVVRINLSNLAPTVLSDDLQELFAKYQVETATVHYGEDGATLGTGDVVLKRKFALQAMNDFKGVAVDGQRLNMTLVDSETKGRSVFDRVQVQGRVTKPSARQPERSFRRGGGGGGRSSGGARSSFKNPLDRVEDGGSSGGRQGGRGGRGKKETKTEADLDAELDAYMKSKK